ncbi:MAG TPA: c-type cytochrome [Terracidiphilus sp.]|nr:c-type cytochrome [Terracidiphilus sp.]
MPARSASQYLILFVALSLAPALPAQQNPAQQTVDWPVYHGGPGGDHYSPLTQINRSNVARLAVAWRYDTGEKGNMETSPIIVGQTLYAYTVSQKVIALDAATGKLKWKFDSGIKGTQPVRGVAYWTGGTSGRIFAGIMNYLYCLDADTGRPIESFGDHGRIDLRRNLRGNYKTQFTVLTSPGIIYKDLIIIGGRDPETHPSPPGDIRAFDVRTGRLRWRFRTIPRPGEPGYKTWPPDAWKTAGAANNWAGMALDAEHGIVYVPTGSAVMDFYGGDRVGNDLYANTLLALDAETGKLLWHFQGVHHDIWDRDFPAPPALFTISRNGARVDALAQTTKQGYLFVFNRLTGQPLFPIHERRFPASRVPGEVTSPTQPVPDLPAPFGRQRLTADMLTDRTPEAHAWAVNAFRQFRSEGQFLPLAVGRQTVVFPGFDGGAEWGGPAIDPVHDILFVNETEMAWTGGLLPASRTGSRGERLYRSQCAVCHGVDRTGSPPAYPSLVKVEKRLTRAKIVDTIQQGSGRMPSFPNIDAADLTSLLDYLRTAPSAAGKHASAVAAPAVNSAAGSAGAAVYHDKCSACHGEHREGMPPSIPTLVGVGSRLDAEQVRAIVLNGRRKMPAVPGLGGAGLGALLAYLGVEQKASVAGADMHGAADAYTFTGYRKFLDPEGYPAIAPPWGTLNAIDLKTGQYLWKIPFGQYPDLVSKGMPDTGTENYGGPIVTAGGVLFIGATVYDRKFRAFDTDTGKLLWEFELPFAGMATPATYTVDGRQFVVIASSGGRDPKAPVGGSYIAFALPQ